MGERLVVPQGQYLLQRLPYRKNQLLRAWDAADEYLLTHLAENDLLDNARIVILNDSFGALAVALSAYKPTSISDSWLSQQATRQNLMQNDIALDQVCLLDSLGLPEEGIDCLLIKVPKTLALLEYQLHQLRPLLKPNAKIIAASMVKTLPPTAWKLLERLIGPTIPSMAVKKARLIFAELNADLHLEANPYPHRYRLENSELEISNHANVFSRDSLDIGTRFLLQHLPDNPSHQDFIDLGCGNGVLGLMLAMQNPHAHLLFVDESYMAVASATENFAQAFAGQRQAQFIVGDGLSDFEPETADCVVCNPPFHQQHVIGDQIATQMFHQAYKTLRKGGELRVIGNRHLNYHISLNKLFGTCRQVAANAKFMIFSATKR